MEAGRRIKAALEEPSLKEQLARIDAMIARAHASPDLLAHLVREREQLLLELQKQQEALRDGYGG